MPRIRRGLVLDPFFESYTDAALGELPLPYTKESIAPATMETMLQDCTTFREMAGDSYHNVSLQVHPSDIGCDLWVTRNNKRKVSEEAPGFWAPEYVSLRISIPYIRSAHQLGPWRLKLGDDGMLHGVQVTWEGEELPPPPPPPRRTRRVVVECEACHATGYEDVLAQTGTCPECGGRGTRVVTREVDNGI